MKRSIASNFLEQFARTAYHFMVELLTETYELKGSYILYKLYAVTVYCIASRPKRYLDLNSESV